MRSLRELSGSWPNTPEDFEEGMSFRLGQTERGPVWRVSFRLGPNVMAQTEKKTMRRMLPGELRKARLIFTSATTGAMLQVVRKAWNHRRGHEVYLLPIDGGWRVCQRNESGLSTFDRFHDIRGEGATEAEALIVAREDAS